MTDSPTPPPETIAEQPVRKVMAAPAPMTPDERAAFLKARRTRNIVLGLSLVGFIILIYLVTVLKMGGAVANRPL